MAGRPKRLRRIAGVPTISGFTPYGLAEHAIAAKPIFVLYEEYESIRLCDYEKYTQQEAAVLMEVSRPTFTRIYMHAREKVAQAFVEGRKICIEGGKVHIDSEWHTCSACQCFFNQPANTVVANCPLCGSKHIGRNIQKEEERLGTSPFIASAGISRRRVRKRWRKQSES